MKLLLTSAGLPNKIIRDKLLELVGKSPRDISVLFIPTAADPEKDKWFVQATIDEINEIGMKLTYMDLKEENASSIRVKLAKCDVVYVNGGNTFYLLDWVRKSGFDKVIKDLANKGKVYVGASAGSILTGPDISISGWDPSWDNNIVGLKDLTGINLISYAISPHFIETERKVLENKMKDVGYPVIALTDKQAVVVEENEIEIIGEGEIITLHESK